MGTVKCDRCKREWNTVEFFDQLNFIEPCPFCKNSFSLEDKEEKAAVKFQKKHKKCYYELKSFPASGGQFSYTFTPTSLGICVHIKCGICNEEKDITDFGNW